MLVDVADPSDPTKYKTRHMAIETVIHFELLAPTQTVSATTIAVPSFPRNFIIREAQLTFTRRLDTSVGVTLNASFGTAGGDYDDVARWSNLVLGNSALVGSIVTNNLQPVAHLGLKINSVVVPNYKEAPMGLTLWLTGAFVNPINPTFSQIDI